MSRTIALSEVIKKELTRQAEENAAYIKIYPPFEFHYDGMILPDDLANAIIKADTK